MTGPESVTEAREFCRAIRKAFPGTTFTLKPKPQRDGEG